jgi:nucleotide-binding universal stress UspA family protein
MNVLLATDGSGYAEAAARFLTRFDFSAGDEIVIFHAVSWVPFLYDKESYLEAFKEVKKEIAPRILDTALDILKPVKAKISTAIMDGAAEQCIIGAAEESRADMIVMGARGVKGIRSFFIGSVTKNVALNSSSPVLITKLPLRPEGTMKVLFVTDGSDYSAEAGRFLATIPFPANAELTILNVIWSDFSDIPERFVLEINERMKDIVARRRSMEFGESESIMLRARKVLEKRFKKIQAESRLGDPSSEILKTAETVQPDIIVMGCRGLRGIKGMMGSVSRNVITHAPYSVLVARGCRGDKNDEAGREKTVA